MLRQREQQVCGPFSPSNMADQYCQLTVSKYWRLDCSDSLSLSLSCYFCLPPSTPFKCVWLCLPDEVDREKGIWNFKMQRRQEACLRKYHGLGVKKEGGFKQETQCLDLQIVITAVAALCLWHWEYYKKSLLLRVVIPKFNLSDVKSIFQKPADKSNFHPWWLQRFAGSVPLSKINEHLSAHRNCVFTRAMF